MFAEIDSESLIVKWEKMLPKIAALKHTKFDDSADKLDININQFLVIYDNLKPQRSHFDNVVRSFIVFDKVELFKKKIFSMSELFHLKLGNII